MARDLFRQQDRLFNCTEGSNLSELTQLHVLEALGVLSQPHMPHATLYVVHKPPLPVHRNDRDVFAGNVATILKDLGPRHDVFADLARLNLLTPHFFPACGEHFFFLIEFIRPERLFFATEVTIDTNLLRNLFNDVVFSDVNDTGSVPVELRARNRLGPG